MTLLLPVSGRSIACTAGWPVVRRTSFSHVVWLGDFTLKSPHYSRAAWVMKRLNWCCTQDDAAYMRERQLENIQRSKCSKSEAWMAEKLISTGRKFGRQTIWGKRIFDFWQHDLGIAVEVDGPEHNPSYDSYRDEYNFRRSAIIVLRVRNWNECDARAALEFIRHARTKVERRQEIGIEESSKWLVKLPYPPSFHDAYLNGTFESVINTTE